MKYKEGDVLLSKYNYFVLVCEDKDGLYGSLICPIKHHCRNIRYSLLGKHKKMFNIFSKEYK